MHWVTLETCCLQTRFVFPQLSYIWYTEKATWRLIFRTMYPFRHLCADDNWMKTTYPLWKMCLIPGIVYKNNIIVPIMYLLPINLKIISGSDLTDSCNFYCYTSNSNPDASIFNLLTVKYFKLYRIFCAYYFNALCSYIPVWLKLLSY